MKEINEDRIRVKKSLKVKLRVEAAKIGEPMGEYIEKIYKFFKQNNK